jgi:hypothetical protein
LAAAVGPAIQAARGCMGENVFGGLVDQRKLATPVVDVGSIGPNRQSNRIK